MSFYNKITKPSDVNVKQRKPDNDVQSSEDETYLMNSDSENDATNGNPLQFLIGFIIYFSCKS